MEIQEKQQELMVKLSMFEQQIQHLNQQLQAVEEGIVEMNSLNFGLDELKGGEGKEVLAPLGRGVFAKTKLISEDLIVDIGNKNFVKKSIPNTKKVIGEQIVKLEEVKQELKDQLKELEKEFMQIIEKAQQDTVGKEK